MKPRRPSGGGGSRAKPRTRVNSIVVYSIIIHSQCKILFEIGCICLQQVYVANAKQQFYTQRQKVMGYTWTWTIPLNLSKKSGNRGPIDIIPCSYISCLAPFLFCFCLFVCLFFHFFVFVLFFVFALVVWLGLGQARLAGSPIMAQEQAYKFNVMIFIMLIITL